VGEFVDRRGASFGYLSVLRGCPLFTETVRDQPAINNAWQRGITHKASYCIFDTRILPSPLCRQ